MTNGAFQPFSIYLEHETWDELGRMAAADGKSRQDIIRQILEEATETGHRKERKAA